MVDKALIQDLARQGISKRNIAAFLCVSLGTVQYHARGLLKPKKLKPHVIFNGRKYTKAHGGWWQATTLPKTMLHRDIWIQAHGPIPLDHEINHKDHNPDNNDLSNLELLSKWEHGKETRAWHSRRCS